MNRRSLLSSALTFGAATVAVGAAAAIPAVIAQTAQVTASKSRVLELVDAFDAATVAMLEAAEGEAFHDASDHRSRIIEDLLGEPPANIADLNAKITALLPLFSEADESETPDILLEIIARDVKALVKGGAQ